MFIIYAISSIDRNYIYVGMTENLESRLHRHNNGQEKTTRPYAPFKLIFTEEQSDRKSARQRERYWKSGTGKRQLRKLKDRNLSK